MTGSLMRDEVVEAIQYTSHEFCLLDEVQDKVGAKIAELCKAESAVVTAGCFSAITLGTAGVLTGNSQENAAKLPHLEGTGMKSEVIMQKGHAIGYANALSNTGCKVVVIETMEEVEKPLTIKPLCFGFEYSVRPG